MNIKEFDYSLLLDMDFLTEASIVFDIAANIGVWADQIYNKYHPKMYCFEPAEYPFTILNETYKNNPDFKLFKFGLGKMDRTFDLYLTNDLGNDASEFLESKRRRYRHGVVKTEKCILKEFIQFTKDNNINHIDLLALNCEGGEFEILEHLIDMDYLNNINCLLISFHIPLDGVLIEKHEQRLGYIVDSLTKTHKCEWICPRMWEKWVRK